MGRASRVLVGVVALTTVACVPVSADKSMRASGSATSATKATEVVDRTSADDANAGGPESRGAPVAPDEVLLTQPDGAVFTAMPWGDRLLNGYETLDGYSIVKDAGSVWRIADGRSPDGHLRPGTLRAEITQAAARVERHLRPDPATAADPGPPPPTAPPAEGVAPEGVAPEGAPFVPSLGSQKSLVILVSFTDQAPVGSVEADWTDKFFGATGSVRDYYDEASYGQFSLDPATESYGTANNGVVGWLPLNSAHPDSGPNGDYQAARQTVHDAVAASNPYVNYASFDTNADGYISPTELHVTVITAGYETSYGGANAQCGPSTWAHRTSTDSATTALVDNTYVGYYGYTTFGEWHCKNNDAPGQIATIGVMAHELGHDLGLPDLYDTDGSSEGVGKWSLMGTGSWGYSGSNRQGSSPTLPDAWSRVAQGWVTPTQITGAANGISIAQASTTADVKQLRDNPNGVDWSKGNNSGSGEYFLVENRQQTGYDAGLPSCGLLVWHIDESVSPTSPNTTDTRRLVDVEEADGLGHLDSKTNRGDSGDPFPGSSSNFLFNAASNPNSNLNGGGLSGVSIQPVSTNCGPTMSANLAATLCPPDDTNEPNQGLTTATRIRRQAVLSGVACDDDYYALDALAGSTVTISTSFSNASGNLELAAYDSTGAQLASSTSTDDSENLTFIAATTGKYYLRVYGYNGAQNAYTFTADHTLCPPDDGYEPNDTSATATPISAQASLYGAACPYDKDYFKIRASSAGQITATAQYSKADMFIDLYLYDAANNQVARSTSFSDQDAVTYNAPGPGTYYLALDGWNKNTYNLTVSAPSSAAAADFDGDGDSDVAVFRPSGSGWFVQGGLSTSWGAAGDVPISGDFNGDTVTDVAVFRPADQTWYVQPSASFPAGLTTQWGIAGDVAVPADFNGDGITDIAVFRPSDQTWYVQPSASFPAGLATQWGVAGDVPIPADFDGDGHDEVAVYRPSDRTWYSQGSALATQWGIAGDIPIPVDFNGDGRDDVAVYRPSDQTWYVQGGIATQWGKPGDRAVPADYDGDGDADVAVFRPSDQTWYVQGGLSTQWGATSDIAVVVPYATRLMY